MSFRVCKFFMFSNIFKVYFLFFSSYIYCKNYDHVILNDITLELSSAISFTKAEYHERLAFKLNDSKTAPKTFWSILKTFVNGSKIPLIPPLLVNNEFVTDFLVKANLFNDFIREQCRPMTALFLTIRPLKL